MLNSHPARRLLAPFASLASLAPSLGLALALALPVGLAAQQPDPSQPGVARLGLLRGDVSTRRADAGDWTAAALNQPLLAGDAVASAAASRAELALDYAHLLRLGENAQATLATLTDSQIQIQLGQGTADFVVLDGADATSEIDTPNLGVHPQGPGLFRIEVNSDSETVVIVRRGDVSVTTPQGSASLHDGQSITVEGASDAEPEYQIADAPPPDAWDQWNDTRDRQLAQGLDNANRYYTGLSDLDTYGRWVYVPGYGQVWAPDAAPGWVPYSAGSWVWEPVYGWTWVSAEPWGWAPYHYGRWFYYGANWVWWPGPVTPTYRPLWAPAYVSFIGLRLGGVGVGVGAGFASIGWIPIGPADPFRPWWGGGARLDVVSPGAEVNARLIAPLAPLGFRGRIAYSNLDRMATDPVVARAVVTVPADRFGQGPVGPGLRQSVRVEDIRRGQLLRGTLPVVPTRASLSPTNRPANLAALPRAALAPAPHFYGARPAPASIPFSQQQARIRAQLAAQSPQSPQSPQSTHSSEARPEPRARPAEPPTQPGFHRFGDPAAPPAHSPQPDATSPQRTSPDRTSPQRTAPQPQAHAGDPSWHSFQPGPPKSEHPAPKPNNKKPPAKPAGGGGKPSK